MLAYRSFNQDVSDWNIEVSVVQNFTESATTTGPDNVSIDTDARETEVATETDTALETVTQKAKKGSNGGKTNLMFIKTHKCGTSTLVNPFYLKGVRHRLNFVIHNTISHNLKLRSKM